MGALCSALAIFSWLHLIPLDRGLAVVLAANALASGVLAFITKFTADRQMVHAAGLCTVASALVVSGTVCWAIHVTQYGTLYAIPYCVLFAVGSSLFWLTPRDLIGGLVAVFLPPFLVLLTVPNADREWAFYIYLVSITVLASSAIYLLSDRTNQRTFALSAEVEHRATYDGLTGVLNRASWIERAEQRLADATRQNQPVSCLFIDLDRFKRVNDVHGHGAGDRVLQQVAEVLTTFALADRVVGRMGGDEFVVLLPNTDQAEAHIIENQMLRVFEATHDRFEGTVPSIGVATRLPEDSVDQLLHRADLAMIEVKAHHHRTAATHKPIARDPASDTAIAHPASTSS
jgi:diguanylate cyclase (GGDEF)-like protein